MVLLLPGVEVRLRMTRSGGISSGMGDAESMRMRVAEKKAVIAKDLSWNMLMVLMQSVDPDARIQGCSTVLLYGTSRVLGCGLGRGPRGLDWY